MKNNNRNNNKGTYEVYYDVEKFAYGAGVFDKIWAFKYGVITATVFEKIRYWINYNKSEGRNYGDGFYWTYNSIDDMVNNDFFYSSKRTIARVLKKLEEDGLVLSCQPFSHLGDNRKAYTIDPDVARVLYEETQVAIAKKFKEINDNKLNYKFSRNEKGIFQINRKVSFRQFEKDAGLHLENSRQNTIKNQDVNTQDDKMECYVCQNDTISNNAVCHDGNNMPLNGNLAGEEWQDNNGAVSLRQSRSAKKASVFIITDNNTINNTSINNTYVPTRACAYNHSQASAGTQAQNEKEIFDSDEFSLDENFNNEILKAEIISEQEIQPDENLESEIIGDECLVEDLEVQDKNRPKNTSRLGDIAFSKLVIDEWNKMAKKCNVKKVVAVNDKRCRDIINTRKALKKAGLTDKDLFDAMDLIPDSSFLNGGGNRAWRASLDWFVRSGGTNVLKLLEGNFTDESYGKSKLEKDLEEMDGWGKAYENEFPAAEVACESSDNCSWEQVFNFR